MKTFNLELEQRALCTLLKAKPSISESLLSQLMPQHFHYSQTKAVYEFIRNRVEKKKGEIPTFADLRADPRVGAETRLWLKKLKQDPARGPKAVASMLERLNDYRRARLMYGLSIGIIEDLKQEKVDIDALARRVAEEASAANTGNVLQDQFFHFGKNSNTRKRILKILKGEVTPAIPTRFKSFDTENVGFAEQSVVLLTANTGGLKSALAKQLWMNMYKDGHNVLYASFEMGFEECVYRLFGKLTSIDQLSFMHGRLTAKQKREALAAYEAFEAIGKKNGNDGTILSCTDENIGIDQLLGMCAPKGYKVIFIDYLTLLADADQADQWKVLSMVARKCKMFAKKYNCVVVILAQINQDDTLRYSKGVSENADYWWSWIVGDKERETGAIEIRQKKARKGRVFPFGASVDFASGNIVDDAQGLAPGPGKGKIDKFKVSSRGLKEVGETDQEEYYTS